MGIIGYGGFGQFLHKAWDSVEETTVVAVCDAAKSDVGRFDLRFYREWPELLHDSDVDIVCIATPPSTHAEIACAAMEADKHLLIEKPLATTIADAERIIETRNRTGQVAGIDFMMRYNPLIESIRTISQTGVWGPLKRAVVNNQAQDESLPPDHWFWDTNISGGILVEHGVHFFDVINWLVQSPMANVSGFSMPRSDGRIDKVSASVLFENGASAEYYHAFDRPGYFERTEIELIFDLAEIRLSGWIPLSGSINVLCSEESEKQLTNIPGFELTEKLTLSAIEDDSRPDGWGDLLSPEGNGVARIGDNTYQITHRIQGDFGLTKGKSQVYQDCIISLMQDLVRSIENDSHEILVSLEDGLASLKQALGARDGSSTID